MTLLALNNWALIPPLIYSQCIHSLLRVFALCWHILQSPIILCFAQWYFYVWHCSYFSLEQVFFLIFSLTLVLLNPDIPCLGKQCRSRSGSSLFAIQYVNLYQQSGSSNLTGWKLEVGIAGQGLNSDKRNGKTIFRRKKSIFTPNISVGTHWNRCLNELPQNMFWCKNKKYP